MKKTSHPGVRTHILSLDHQSKINYDFHKSVLVPFRWFGRFVPSTGIFTSTALWELYASDFDGTLPRQSASFLARIQTCLTPDSGPQPATLHPPAVTPLSFRERGR
jgi:hypothetical protein